MSANPQTLPSTCPLDCPDHCSLSVDVDAGTVVRVAGSRLNPLTEGYICSKVRRLPEHVHGDHRVRFPRIREGRKGEGAFRRASWDEALTLITEKLLSARNGFGGASILPFSYGGSNGVISQDTTDERLFGRLSASRLLRTVCAMPTRRASEGLYGRMPGISFNDYAHSRLIVIWGQNPSYTGIHLMPKLQEARRKGGRLVVVDPRRTKTAERADLHIAPRPGTDLPIALAVIRWLFAGGHADERFLAAHATGVDELRRRAEPWTLERAASVSGVLAGDIEALAQMWAESSPAVVRCGWGVERNRRGGSAVAAILALPAVGGKFGVRGGGYTMSNSGAWSFDAAAASGVSPSAPRREINMNKLGEVLLEERHPPVQVLFVYNCNPLATMPDQGRVERGLAREDLFTVVFDPVMTDTALWADVVLPATTFLEREELSRGYGSMDLQFAPAVVPPVGESRPNHEVFAELCRRTGVARPGEPEDAASLAKALLTSSPTGLRLRREIEQRGIASPEGGSDPIQFVDVFPRTSDGRIHLVDEALDAECRGGLYAWDGAVEDPAHPLALISPSSDRTISTTLGELWQEVIPLEIHPEDAASRGIADGDAVRVFNASGEIRIAARVTTAVRPGVVMLHKGLWLRHTDGRGTANLFAPSSLADLGGGACFNDARVQVEAAPPPGGRGIA
jgi:anaerobic selenocysteine-containing dehydrogenase